MQDKKAQCPGSTPSELCGVMMPKSSNGSKDGYMYMKQDTEGLLTAPCHYMKDV